MPRGTLWSAAAGLTGPLFHGRTLEADRRAAVDNYKASLASYQQTLSKSLGQVADVLQSINRDAEEYSAQERALNAAAASLRLNQEGVRSESSGVGCGTRLSAGVTRPDRGADGSIS